MKPEIVKALFGDGPTRTLPRGQIVLYEGDSVDYLYCIVGGYVKVYNVSGDRGERTIFIYGPGDIFPSTSYLSGAGLARYFYECLTEAKAYVISHKKLEEKVRDNFDIGEALLAYTNSISQQFIQRIDILSVNDARRKIIALIAFLVAKMGSKEELCHLAIPLTTQEIANMCGLTRETASLQLSKLRKKGILSGSRNLIVDTTKLEKMLPELAISV